MSELRDFIKAKQLQKITLNQEEEEFIEGWREKNKEKRLEKPGRWWKFRKENLAKIS